jgi:enoyl-CoA hydratase/carnithine racemase
MDVARFELSVLDAGRVSALRRVVDARPRVLVLEGTEDFCTGLDLGLGAGGGERDVAERLRAGVEALAACLVAIDAASTVVVAAVRGRALGGGLGLAAVADVVIAEPSARFGLPEALLGLLPAAVFPFVARRVGVARARALFLTGATWSADEAQRAGLVDEVCDDLERGVARTTTRLLRADYEAVAAMKRLVARHFGAPLDYTQDAVAAFTERAACPETHARIVRFQDGLAPWREPDEAEAEA